VSGVKHPKGYHRNSKTPKALSVNLQKPTENLQRPTENLKKLQKPTET
jgi:hypothetical protein